MKKQILFVYLIFGVAVSNFSLDAQAATPELWVNGKRVSQVNIQVVADRRHLKGYFERWLDAAVADLERILLEFGVELSADAPFSIIIGGKVPEPLKALVEKERYPNQASVIRITDQEIYVTSPHGRGLGKAVYTFLHRLGVRWYMPGKWGESLPAGRVLLFDDVIVDGPDFMFRSFYWGAAGTFPQSMQDEHQRWEVRMRTDNEFGFGGHSYSEQIAPLEKYAAEHPEYYSMIGGKRVVSGVKDGQFGDLQLCVSNKAVQQLAIDLARRVLEQRALNRIVSISPNDAGSFCRCKPCDAIGGPSDQTVFLANVVARAIRGDYPEALVGFYAYQHTVEAPERIKLEPNTVPYIVNSFNSLGFDPKIYSTMAVRKTPLAPVIRKWADVSKQTAIRFNWHVWQYPYDWTPYLQDDFRFFLENKGMGAMSQSWASFVHQGWLNYWAYRLAWDVDIDMEAEKAELFRRCYGPAGDAVREAVDSIQKLQPLPVDLLRRKQQLLKTAVAELPDGATRMRTRHILHYFDYLLAREESTTFILDKRYSKGDAVSADRLSAAAKQLNDDRSYVMVGAAARYPVLAASGKFKQVQPGSTASWKDPDIVYRTSHTFVIMAEADKTIAFKLWYDSVGKNDAKARLGLISEEGLVVWKREVPLGSTVEETVNVPRAGAYILEVRMKNSNQFRLEVKNQLFAVNAGAKARLKPFRMKDDIVRYFYVPKGTARFTMKVTPGGRLERATFKITAPDRQVLLSKEDWGGQEPLEITVPPASAGKIWTLIFRNDEDTEVSFSGIPGWLSSAPERLIVPEAYLNQ